MKDIFTILTKSIINVSLLIPQHEISFSFTYYQIRLIKVNVITLKFDNAKVMMNLNSKVSQNSEHSKIPDCEFVLFVPQ